MISSYIHTHIHAHACMYYKTNRRQDNIKKAVILLFVYVMCVCVCLCVSVCAYVYMYIYVDMHEYVRNTNISEYELKGEHRKFLNNFQSLLMKI